MSQNALNQTLASSGCETAISKILDKFGCLTKYWVKTQIVERYHDLGIPNPLNWNMAASA